MSAPAVEVFDEIVAANKNFMAAFDGGDAEGLSKLYTEDCKVLPSGAPVQCGRKGEWLSKYNTACL